jgi:hypothetical protein
VLGAVVYDRGGGLQAAFLLQTAINTAALLLALLVVPVWLWAGSSSNSGDCAEDAAASPPAAAAADGALSGTWQLSAITGAADAAACTTSAELHSGVMHHRDTLPASHALCCVDSAYDVVAVHHKATTAAAVATAAKGKDSHFSLDSCHAQVEHLMHVASAQQQQQQQRLDMACVLATLADWVVSSQCLLVLLEQALTSSLLVVIPAAMGTPTWLVGVVYVAMVSMCRRSDDEKSLMPQYCSVAGGVTGQQGSRCMPCICRLQQSTTSGCVVSWVACIAHGALTL